MFLHPPKASKSAYNLRNPYTHIKVYIQLEGEKKVYIQIKVYIQPCSCNYSHAR